MRRLPIAVGGALVALGLLWPTDPVAGQGDPADRAVDVIEVSGLLDPILVDFIEESIAVSEAEDSVALVLQLNSPGSVVDDERLRRLADRIGEAEVDVAVWVGPSGARATGGAAELAGLAVDTGMAPGTRIGNVGERRLPESEYGPILGPEGEVLRDGTVNDEEAVELGVVDRLAPTVGDFNVDLDGFVTESVEGDDGQIRREPVTQTRFAQLSLPSQLLHTAASPAVAYLFLVLGMFLVLFEFYTAGVGVAAVVGAGFLVLAGYGLGVLPINVWALGLLVGSMFAFAVDVQTGVPRFWTVVGLLAFLVGTLNLYDGVQLSWLTIAIVLALVLVAVLAGMPSMVRTRFSTPTIGREWMIGEMGTAVGAIGPEGTVMISDALWRARVNRATPIPAGDPVRVVDIEGLVLEVEPEEGGARDYRDRG